MSSADFLALLPLLITAYVAAALMVLIAFWRSAAAAFWTSVIGFAASFAGIFFALRCSPRAVTPLLRVDAFSLYFTGLVLLGAILVALLARDYLPAHAKRGEAYYVLLMIAVLGMAGMASSSHFGSFFLALETATISLYGLIGYTRGVRPSLEAAIKYLVLAATSSAFLLFGIALIYSEFGTMDLRLLADLMPGGMSVASGLGLAMLLAGFGFKLAVVPFHMWSPDVYQGAPAPTTALIATGSKGAVFALLLRFFVVGHLASEGRALLAVTVLAVTTVLVGNLLALLQTNLKRLLAYSSVAHVGYLLIPLLARRPDGPASIAFYLGSYFATAIAAFGVISALSRSRSEGDVEDLSAFRGLAFQRPVLAAIFALCMLSLTGIPLTAGFIAKFYIFAAAIESGLWGLVIVGVVGSGISAFYYLRVLGALYARPDADPTPTPSVPTSTAAALAICTAAIIILGVYPTPLIRLAEAAARAVGL
mgnify:CR=1 FL=1